MTTLDEKILDCLRIHIGEEKDTPTNAAEVCEALIYLLRYLEGYYEEMDDKAGIADINSNTRGFLLLQQVLVRSIMGDVNRLRKSEEKFQEL